MVIAKREKDTIENDRVINGFFPRINRSKAVLYVASIGSF